MHRKTFPFRLLCLKIVFIFLFSTIQPQAYAQAQVNILPPVGTMLNITPGYAPVVVKGLRVDPTNPFQFDFLVDPGDSNMVGEELKDESTKLIKYFLASLTVPEADMWVNLSPYEEDRIISDQFGMTEMGRELLAQDYLLKQLTASLMYPEGELGQEFWAKIKTQTDARRSSLDARDGDRASSIEHLASMFNKVWIVPEEATVFEGDGTAFVVESRLRVMLESDYLAMQKGGPWSVVRDLSQNTTTEHRPQNTDVIKEIILPVLEEEVNSGTHFAPLRQIYNSLILASWYKRKLKNSVLTQVYVDQNKTKGVTHDEEDAAQKIYDQYVESFKTGVYDYIKEEYDPVNQQIIPRKYFSGGLTMGFGPDTAALNIVDKNRSDYAAMTRSIAALALGLLAFTVELHTSETFAQDAPRSFQDIIDYGYSPEDRSAIFQYIKDLETGKEGFDSSLTGEEFVEQSGRYKSSFADFYNQLRAEVLKEALKRQADGNRKRIEFKDVLAIAEKLLETNRAMFSDAEVDQIVRKIQDTTNGKDYLLDPKSGFKDPFVTSVIGQIFKKKDGETALDHNRRITDYAKRVLRRMQYIKEVQEMLGVSYSGPSIAGVPNEIWDKFEPSFKKETAQKALGMLGNILLAEDPRSELIRVFAIYQSDERRTTDGVAARWVINTLNGKTSVDDWSSARDRNWTQLLYLTGDPQIKNKTAFLIQTYWSKEMLQAIMLDAASLTQSKRWIVGTTIVILSAIALLPTFREEQSQFIRQVADNRLESIEVEDSFIDQQESVDIVDNQKNEFTGEYVLPDVDLTQLTDAEIISTFRDIANRALINDLLKNSYSDESLENLEKRMRNKYGDEIIDTIFMQEVYLPENPNIILSDDYFSHIDSSLENSFAVYMGQDGLLSEEMQAYVMRYYNLGILVDEFGEYLPSVLDNVSTLVTDSNIEDVNVVGQLAIISNAIVSQALQDEQISKLTGDKQKEAMSVFADNVMADFFDFMTADRLQGLLEKKGSLEPVAVVLGGYAMQPDKVKKAMNVMDEIFTPRGVDALLTESSYFSRTEISPTQELFQRAIDNPEVFREEGLFIKGQLGGDVEGLAEQLVEVLRIAENETDPVAMSGLKPESDFAVISTSAKEDFRERYERLFENKNGRYSEDELLMVARIIDRLVTETLDLSREEKLEYVQQGRYALAWRVLLAVQKESLADVFRELQEEDQTKREEELAALEAEEGEDSENKVPPAIVDGTAKINQYYNIQKTKALDELEDKSFAKQKETEQYYERRRRAALESLEPRLRESIDRRYEQRKVNLQSALRIVKEDLSLDSASIGPEDIQTFSERLNEIMNPSFAVNGEVEVTAQLLDGMLEDSHRQGKSFRVPDDRLFLSGILLQRLKDQPDLLFETEQRLKSEQRDKDQVIEGARDEILGRLPDFTMYNAVVEKFLVEEARLDSAALQINALSDLEVFNNGGTQGIIYYHPENSDQLLKLFAAGDVHQQFDVKEKFRQLYGFLKSDEFLQSRIVDMEFVDVNAADGQKYWGIVMPEIQGEQLSRSDIHIDKRYEAREIIDGINELAYFKFGYENIADTGRYDWTTDKSLTSVQFENFIIQKTGALIMVDPINVDIFGNNTAQDIQTQQMKTYLGELKKSSLSVGFGQSFDSASLTGQDDGAAVTENDDTLGGIDLNPANWELKMKGVGGTDCSSGEMEECLQFDIPEEQIERMRLQINGLVPVIINIQPMTNLPLFLGLGDDGWPDSEETEEIAKDSYYNREDQPTYVY